MPPSLSYRSGRYANVNRHATSGTNRHGTGRDGRRAPTGVWDVDPEELLVGARPDRDHEAATLGQLLVEAVGYACAAAAATAMAWNGARSGKPSDPSPTTTSTRP